MDTALRAGVLTTSDKILDGFQRDEGGLLLKELLESLPTNVVAYRVVPNNKKIICDTLRSMIRLLSCDLILTIGGTGLASRDVTPESTLRVLDKEIPGIAEAVRYECFKNSKDAVLSRAVAGISGKTLIVNLPAKTELIQDVFHMLLPIIEHALAALRENSLK